MANTIDQELYQFIMQLNELEKQSVLHMLKTFVNGRARGPERITIEQYNQELEESEKEIEAGHFTTQEDLEKEMEKW